MLKLDHFAFGIFELKSGISQMSEILGAHPIGGGKHLLFGTHNALWRIETNSYPIYLEVIAIDYDAITPARSRWFGLDDPLVQARIENKPSLLTFIANTADINNASKNMPQNVGEAIKVSRDDLSWKFSLLDDGSLIDNGALPYLIEWPKGVKPVDNMAEQNIRLLSMGGARLSELDIDLPCEVKTTNAKLELVLLSARNEQCYFST
ncbi:MAG: VOC family protein [Devosiaceae bacterium]|nr:VOC family protein [Devosiaceae bacterium]